MSAATAAGWRVEELTLADGTSTLVERIRLVSKDENSRVATADGAQEEDDDEDTAQLQPIGPTTLRLAGRGGFESMERVTCSTSAFSPPAPMPPPPSPTRDSFSWDAAESPYGGAAGSTAGTAPAQSETIPQPGNQPRLVKMKLSAEGWTKLLVGAGGLLLLLLAAIGLLVHKLYAKEGGDGYRSRSRSGRRSNERRKERHGKAASKKDAFPVSAADDGSDEDDDEEDEDEDEDDDEDDNISSASMERASRSLRQETKTKSKPAGKSKGGKRSSGS